MANGATHDDKLREASVPVHIEAVLRPSSTVPSETIRARVLALLEAQGITVYRDGDVDFADDAVLKQEVQSLHICDTPDVPFWQGDVRVHVFQLSDEGVCEETLEGGDPGGNSVNACYQWVLPCHEFHGLWDSLIFGCGIKNRLLEYISTALLFSDQCVDPNIISWNKIVLLHGPPGTGKTTLCKALAQKASIRLSGRYPNAHLLEINAHSLFSKWFSESGKLVSRLFDFLNELVDEEDSLVCVLIDEVESLTAARTSALGGAEPSDAIRVVNALLTHIDQLKARENVLILTTSNMSEAIDIAFVDRADIKQYIGPPMLSARYAILRSCVDELMRVGIISPQDNLLVYQEAQVAAPRFSFTTSSSDGGGGSGGGSGGGGGIGSHGSVSGIDAEESGQSAAPDLAHLGQQCPSVLLLYAADLTDGFSGRTLRKLPLQAHAAFVQRPSASMSQFLQALVRAALRERSNRHDLLHR